MKRGYTKVKDNNCKKESNDPKKMVKVGSIQDHKDVHDGLEDMPEWTEEMFKKARIGHYYIPPELKDRLNKTNN